jgi:hypothetical protein
MRLSLAALLALAACGSSPAAPDAGTSADAPPADTQDAPIDAPALFGTLGGMCGVLAEMQLTEVTPELFRDSFTFAREFVDPVDRPLLTAGGRRLLEVPNAGGSSQLSEAFAFEELARCETAGLLKTETEIIYDTQGKITDLEVTIAGHKIGVSVTRAFAFPLGTPYTPEQATTLITRKLEDILASSANVSAEDRWDKQILAVMAYDGQAADVVAQVWAGIDASIRADTLVVVTVTEGADTFIYSN